MAHELVSPQGGPSCDYYLALAQTCLLKKDYTKAEECLEQAIQIDYLASLARASLTLPQQAEESASERCLGLGGGANVSQGSTVGIAAPSCPVDPPSRAVIQPHTSNLWIPPPQRLGLP